jgi:hypothetical protein
VRLTTVGVGAANSPRFAPAGLLVVHRRTRVMIDGGPGAEPVGPVHAWLLTDEQAELTPAIRRLSAARGLVTGARSFSRQGLLIEPRPVVHTNHDAFGFLITAGGRTAVWAPEFWMFPGWAAATDLMFAEAAGWDRPIRFAGGVGGHLHVLAVAEQARRKGIRRLVFAHIGRPTIRALDRGDTPPFGEFAHDGQRFVLR